MGALTPKNFQQPSREVKTICPYCGVGCGFYLGVRGNKTVSVRGDTDSPVNKGSLCVKGRFGYDFVNHPDRLTSPLIKRNGKFVKATWDEALELIAKKFSQYRGEKFATLSSAKCTDEENYIIQKFARAVMGTNHIDHCARLCHAPTVAGLAQSFGSGAMTNSINEVGEAACIQKLSKLYLTLNGRVGITLGAVLIYAAYGAVTCAFLFPLWARFWRGKRECAILSSAVNAWCLLYGFAYLMICRLMRIEEFRFLLWCVCLLILSVILSFITGWAFGWLLKGRRHIYVGITAFIAIMFLVFLPGRRQATPEKELPNVVMVTLDTTRADRIHS